METLGTERYRTGPVDKKDIFNNPARMDSAYDSISGKSFFSSFVVSLSDNIFSSIIKAWTVQRKELSIFLKI